MNIKISYLKNKLSNSVPNLVLFSDDKFTLNGIKKNFSNSEFQYVKDLLKKIDLKKNLLIFEISSKKNIILISIKKIKITPTLKI